uniref:Uncharacterized protein n=1 Tax=Panagrolaimus davidi TaxID=227884 RepID=A0A914PCC4_9BILA
METPTFSSSTAAAEASAEELNQSNETEEKNIDNQKIDETPRKRRRYDFLYEFEDGNEEGNDNEGNAETPRRRPPPLLLPPPAPIFHPRNSNQNQSKFPPQKIAYIQSKIEEKLADIEIESRKEIDKLFQKFSSQIRAAAQNLQKQNDPKSKE